MNILTTSLLVAALNAAEATTTSSAPPPAARPTFLAAYVEVLGPGGVGSLNIEPRLLPWLALRAGIGFVPCVFCLDQSVWAMVPVSVHAFLGGTNHHLELGLGATFALVDDDDARFLVPEVGYRYERPDGGTIVRLTLTPMLRMNDPGDAMLWGGLSIGRAW